MGKALVGEVCVYVCVCVCVCVMGLLSQRRKG